MKKRTLALGLPILLLFLGLAVSGIWYVRSKLPTRQGSLHMDGLIAAVAVDYDERGVPHIHAENEADLYRALGYVHAQDRLFQMEMLRRLANGELAEVLGPTLLDTDRLFRTLRLREQAKVTVAAMDRKSPAAMALLAYLDGVNQFQSTHPAPMEFDVLGIPQHPFTPQDSAAVAGYMAYSFAAAFKTEPLMTFVRDKLGADYLDVFDVDGHPAGGLQSLQTRAQAPRMGGTRLSAQDWEGLDRLAEVSRSALESAGIGDFQGSNAWVIAGKRSQSGKPILAGDPHIGYSVPAVWYEAHLNAPAFELYGHFQALNPVALLGHNARFGWTITMFENDDIDLIAEKPNPVDKEAVWDQGQWVALHKRDEIIHVKGAPDHVLTLRSGPHGPIISDAFQDNFDVGTPIAMWWAFLQPGNALLDAFYALNRADTRDKAREAVQHIHAPGLNIVWASASGDIAWWAAAQLPQRPAGVNPMFILDAAKGEAEKHGYYNFNFNPQEENPARGYIISANQQPGGAFPVPGYYLPPDRAKRLVDTLGNGQHKWTSADMARLQLDGCSGYPLRLLHVLLPLMETLVTDPNERAFMEPLQKWDGCYEPGSVAATLFSEFSYTLARAVFEDELGAVQFKNLLGTPTLDHALPLLVANARSPWWDNVKTPLKENRFETLRMAWSQALTHLQNLYGTDLVAWTWGNTHTLTHGHPLGLRRPLDLLFNVGPFPVAGGRESPNNMASPVGPAPWAVRMGPSTRRVIDFGAPEQSLGINPLGQSGVLFDRHYDDQAERFVTGKYVRQHLGPKDVQSHTRSTLTLTP